MEFNRTKNVDTRVIFPMMKNDGTVITGATGLDSEFALYGAHGAGAPSFSDCTHEATEIGTTGIYYLDVSAAELNDDYGAIIQVKSSSAGAVTQILVFHTKPADVNAVQVAGTAQAAGDLKTLIDTVTTDVAAVHVHVGTIDGHITADYGATEKTCVDLLDDAVGGLADIHTDVGTAITQTTAANIASAVWGALCTTYNTVLTFGKYLGGAPTGATLAADTAAIKAETVLIVADTGELQTNQGNWATATGFSTATEMAKVPKSDSNVTWNNTALASLQTEANDALVANHLDDLGTDWLNGGRLDLLLDAAGAGGTPPTVGDIADAVWDEDVSTHLTNSHKAGYMLHTVGDVVDDLHNTDLPAVKTETASLLAIATKLDTLFQLDGAVYKFTANALEEAPTGGSGGATAQQVWEYTTRVLSANTNLNDPDAEDVAAAVWAYDMTDFAGVNTAGVALLDTPPESNLWDVPAGITTYGAIVQLLPDIAGDISDLLGDWEDGGRLDLLLDSAAAAGTGGSGGDPWDYVLTTAVTGVPIVSANVWVSTEEDGGGVCASGVTDVTGTVRFYLPPGTYYVWRQKTGFDFVNPDTEIVTEVVG